jgi:hypothetical protein
MEVPRHIPDKILNAAVTPEGLAPSLPNPVIEQYLITSLIHSLFDSFVKSLIQTKIQSDAEENCK